MKQEIYKSAQANTVIVPVLVPDVEDRNWDIITQAEIQKTAYEFITNLEKKSVDIDHINGTDIEWAEFVESYIAPVDMELWENNIIKKGSWVVWIKLPEAIYKQALDWEFWAVSMDWRGEATKI